MRSVKVGHYIDGSEKREIVVEGGKRFFQLSREYSTGGFSLSLTRASEQPEAGLRVRLHVSEPDGMVIQALTTVTAKYLLTQDDVLNPDQVEVIEAT